MCHLRAVTPLRRCLTVLLVDLIVLNISTVFPYLSGFQDNRKNEFNPYVLFFYMSDMLQIAMPVGSKNTFLNKITQ